MGKTSKKSSQSIEALRKKKKECEQKRRDRIKNDPELYEEAKRKERERYHARRKLGKIKIISELKTEREKRAKRKNW